MVVSYYLLTLLRQPVGAIGWITFRLDPRGSAHSYRETGVTADRAHRVCGSLSCVYVLSLSRAGWDSGRGPNCLTTRSPDAQPGCR